jgi:nitrogen fixation NifU-like protein
MQDQLYRDIILEHWKSPQNSGVLKNADIDIEQNNPFCGDKIRLTVIVKKGKIADIAFLGEGCAISQAYASLFTQELISKSLAGLKKIKPENILSLVDIKLAPTRVKCALLIYSALKKGLLQKSSFSK